MVTDIASLGSPPYVCLSAQIFVKVISSRLCIKFSAVQDVHLESIRQLQLNLQIRLESVVPKSVRR